MNKIKNYFAFFKSKLLPEFFASFFLALFFNCFSLFIGYGDTKNQKYFLGYYFFSPIFIGLFSGFVIYLSIIIAFKKFKCDFSPTTSILKSLRKQQTWKITFLKMIFQFLGAFTTVFVFYAFNHNKDIINQTITLDKVTEKNNHDTQLGSFFIIVFAEIFITLLLILAGKNKIVDQKYHYVMAGLIVTMAVWMSQIVGTSSFNPAKGLAKQMTGLIFGAKKGNAKSISTIGWATLAILIGNFITPFIYHLFYKTWNNFIQNKFSKWF